MKIQKLIIGTGNKAKLEEWSKFFEGIVEVGGIPTGLNLEEPDETGETVGENAAIKASYYAAKLNSYVLSDDGGFEIDALDGFPGVRSKRIYQDGAEGSDAQIQELIFKKMEDIPDNKRAARQKTAVTISDPKGKIIFEDQETLEGKVLRKNGPVLIAGYPYRSLLFIPILGKTYAEFTDSDHEQYNHKKKLAKRVIDFLRNF